MSLSIYMDHHVPRAISIGLRLRGVDVLTAYEDRSHELSDSDLLDRAHELRRILFTQDDDLLLEASTRHKKGIPFSGIVYAHQLRVSIGKCIADLELMANVGEIRDIENNIFFLPL